MKSVECKKEKKSVLYEKQEDLQNTSRQIEGNWSYNSLKAVFTSKAKFS